MPGISHNALVMVGDGARALFFRTAGSSLEPKLSVENVFEQHNPPTHELGTERPTRGSEFAGGSSPNVGRARSNIEQTDWHQLNEDRFAKDIAKKLYQLAHANRYQRLVIVAPPKVLGVLRKELHKEVLERVEAEIPKDFAHATTGSIQQELSKQDIT
jgi:protein required for attachment to host cells